VEICKSIILSAVLYGGETWSSTLREGRRLKMFDKTALRETFGSKSDEETEGRRRLNEQELNNLTTQQIF
jgi:hypothetical protein